MNIKDKLGLIKKLSGKTQAKMAAELGVSFPTLNSWINGKSTPHELAAQRIDAFYLLLTGQNVIAVDLLEGKKAGILKKRTEQPKILQLLQTRPDLYEQFLLKLTYNTNRIEGSTLTEPETAAILFQNAALPDKTIIEQMEVKNHQAAFRYLLQFVALEKITEEFILKMHAMLMNGIRDDAGQYRHHAVRIVGANVPTANFLKVPDLIHALIEDIQKGEKDVIGFAARIHSRFEQIHPFSDGNGRVGRLLLWAMLLKQNLPPAVISQNERRFYIMYLNQSQLERDYGKLIDFVCDGILTGYEILNGN